MKPSDFRVIPTPLGVHFRLDGDNWVPKASLRYSGPEPEAASRILCRSKSSVGARCVECCEASEADIRGAIDPALGPAAYRLTVDRRVEIKSGDAQGLRSGLITLVQLLACSPRFLPRLIINDEPALPVRGVMLDISRDKVPTMAQLKEAVDQFEMLMINHLQLYTEHTFAYTGHEDVWQHASPMTPDEVRDLDAYCRERGIELAANQNCLGHLHRWLNLPRYAPLAEILSADTKWTFESDDGRKFDRTGPHSLCPTDPRSLEFIRGLLDQLLPCFSSPLVNIGCDEAFDVGQGRSREAVASRGRAAVYFEWLRAVDEIVKSHGKRSLFWADIALRHPESLDQIPDGATPLAWGYEDAEPFHAAFSAFRRRDRKPWMCPGTSSWLSMTGRTRVRRANIDGAAARARDGMLITDWGDRGHRQHWPIALYSIAHGAHAAWRGEAHASPFDPRAAALHLFGDESGDLGIWLDELGEVDADLSRGLRNTNALFTELHRPLSDLPAGTKQRGSQAEWEAVRERLGALRDRLDAMPGEAMPPLVRSELEHTLWVAEHAADKAIVCRAEPGLIPRAPARIRLAADMGAIAEEHRALWPRRNRPGGLDDSATHYERIVEDYEHPGGA